MKSGAIVLRWPEMKLYLVEKSGRGGILERSTGPQIPDAWANATEIRVIADRHVLFRHVEVQAMRGGLIDAALFMIEPTLPIPIEELAVSYRSVKRPHGKKFLQLGLIEKKNLAKIKEEVGAIASGPVSRRTSWIGSAPIGFLPEKPGAYRAGTWAGIFANGIWEEIQTAATGIAASEILTRKRKEKLEWFEISEDAEVLGIMRAPSEASWSGERARNSPDWFTYWPAALVVFSLLLASAGFGMRGHAAAERAKLAQLGALKAFQEAFPGKKVVSPVEQLASEKKIYAKRFEVLSERFAKKGSALDVLAAIEASVTPEEIRIDDLRITPREVVIVGTAVGSDAVQKLASGMETRLGLKEAPDAKYRQSGSGLGWDFTVEASR